MHSHHSIGYDASLLFSLPNERKPKKKMKMHEGSTSSFVPWQVVSMLRFRGIREQPLTPFNPSRNF